MRRFVTQIILAGILCMLQQHSFASGSTGKPKKEVQIAAPADSAAGTLANVSKTKAKNKMCSCQILHLESTNYRHANFAVFAEKTNSKNWTTDINITKKILDKEKKHLKNFFYEKLEVTNYITDATDCRSLYKKLKFDNRSLVLYDILDADSRR